MELLILVDNKILNSLLLLILRLSRHERSRILKFRLQLKDHIHKAWENMESGEGSMEKNKKVRKPYTHKTAQYKIIKNIYILGKDQVSN